MSERSSQDLFGEGLGVRCFCVGERRRNDGSVEKFVVAECCVEPTSASEVQSEGESCTPSTARSGGLETPFSVDLLAFFGRAERSRCFGRNAALMSPIPTKNSSTWRRCQYLLGEGEGRDVHGMTFKRFGEPSQTSARSSIMTTILVSHGKSRCRLLRVIPAEYASARFEKSEEILTAALVPTQYPSTEEATVRVDDLAYLGGVRSSSHCINMHLVNLRYRFEKVVQSRSASHRISNDSMGRMCTTLTSF